MSELSTSEETKKTLPQVKSARELAFALSFKRDKESSDGRVKVYTKPFKTSEGEGSMVLDFDTVYSGGEKPYQHERIGFSVRLGDRPAWKREFPVEDMKKVLGGLEIKKDKYGAFEKSSLKQDGYQKLYDFLSSELNEGGQLREVSERFIAEMVEEQAEGVHFIENKLIPEVQERFLGFPNVVNNYEEDKIVYFYGNDEKGKKTVPVIQFLVGPTRIGPSILVETGRSKIEDGQVEENYFHSYGKPYTVAPPEEMRDIDYPRARWTFDELDQALEELSGHLESKRSQ